MYGLAKLANNYYGIKGDDLTDLTSDKEFVDMYEKDNSLGQELRNAEVEGIMRDRRDKRFANNAALGSALAGGVLAPVATGLAALKSRRIGNLVDTAPEAIVTGASVGGMFGGVALGKRLGDKRTDRRREDYLENTLKPKEFAYQDNELAMMDYKEEKDYDGFLRANKPLNNEMFAKMKADQQNTFKVEQSAQMKADQQNPFAMTREAQEGRGEMYGLAKIASDYNDVYDNNPDLDELRIRDMEATQQLRAKKEVFGNERRDAMTTPGLVGGGIGAGAGVLYGHHQLANKGITGGLGLGIGALVGRGLAGRNFDKTSPLAEGLEQSRHDAQNAQDAHVNRWHELTWGE